MTRTPEMESWKLQTAINGFLDACETDSPDIIRQAKLLRHVSRQLRHPEQQADLLKQVFPLLDDPRAHVRQCASCVINKDPISKSAELPEQINVVVYGDHGEKYFEKNWKN